QPLRHNVMGCAHRLMAWLLHRSAARSFVSIPAWEGTLGRLAPSRKRVEWLPVPSTLPTEVGSDRVAAIPQRLAGATGSLVVGHFGTFGVPIRRLLARTLPPLLLATENRRGLLVGRDSDAFTNDMVRQCPALAGRITATGSLLPEATAASLAACD